MIPNNYFAIPGALCPDCKGAGEVHTGHIEPETGYASLVTCDLCGGAGEFPADEDTRTADMERLAEAGAA
jgi:DnaJ-class molecular chaperone